MPRLMSVVRRPALMPKEKDGYERERGTSNARGYDENWSRCRNAYLALHPLCEECLPRGDVVAAEEVHHKIPLKDGGSRLDFDNLQALCRSCHKRVEHAFKREKNAKDTARR